MSEQDQDYGFETLAIHAGAAPDPTTGARATPIYQTTSYVFDDVDHAASLFNLQRFGNIYSRITNPTVSVLEERIAALEGGTAACAVASGHAAQFIAFLNLMEPGDEIISSTKLYGGSITQFSETFPEVRLARALRRPDRAQAVPEGAAQADQGDLRRERLEPGRRDLPTSRRSPRSRTTPASR